jgi:hypothetical protein
MGNGAVMGNGVRGNTLPMLSASLASGCFLGNRVQRTLTPPLFREAAFAEGNVWVRGFRFNP